MFIISLQLLHIGGSKVQVFQKKSSIVFKMFVECFFRNTLGKAAAS
jgi:hypothetical protein